VVTAFKKCEGVVSATASKEEGQAKVVYDPAKTNPAALVKAFKKTGGPKYAASEIDSSKAK